MSRRRQRVLRALNEAYRLSLRSAWRRYLRAARDPEGAQQARLRSLVRETRGTAFAAAHGLSRVKTLAEFQDAIPIRDYDGHAPWIERVKQGEARVLTRSAPLVFEKSSGSTHAAKYVPYTRPFLDEYSAGTGPWLYDLLTRRPALRRGSSYWSISPAGVRDEVTAGGIRIGFQDDTEYFPPPVRKLLRRLLPVPPEVARLPDVPTCRYVTLRYLVADPCLGFLSVWSPSYLTLLLEFARKHADRLAHDVARGTLTPPSGRLGRRFPDLPGPNPPRAAAIREAFPQSGPLRLERLWPGLALVSCWADAAAAQQLPALKALLPSQVEVQPKGLFATEGALSFPLLDFPGASLIPHGHLLELQPADALEERPLPLHAAVLGERYLPLLTTQGGLFRYRLGDVVEVVGRFERTPLVRFVGRADGVSDLAGEKLAPGQVAAAIAKACTETGVKPGFAMLAPTIGKDGAPGGYRLYAESNDPVGLARLAIALEDALRKGYHYDHCRRLEQLDPVDARAVRDGWSRYEIALVARGVRAGDVKPSALRRESWWDEVFPA
ncbi:MAG: GH3 auxin-responsive promoter family protein [Planctomycetes bacterium]|nr:GH3 auxin-responsive promoter family protein [Planctomycetota bacterium]